MRRTQNRRNMAFIVLGPFLLLLALGCTAGKQYPSAYEIDQSGWAWRIANPSEPPPSQHGSASDHDRRAVNNEARVEQASQP